MYKKYISLLLAIVMVFSLVVYNSVFADEEESFETVIEENAPSGTAKGFLTANMDDSSSVVYHEINPNATLVSENSNLALYLDRETSTVQILDKRNSYVWASTPSNLTNARMSNEWQRFAGSLAVVEFISPTGVMTRSSMHHANAEVPVYEITNDGFTATIHFYEADIKVKIIFSLSEDGLTVEVPDENIENMGSNKMGRLYIMPFLGASHSDEIPGYLFIPDGSGALMRFAPSREYRSSYVAQIYGSNLAVTGGIVERNSLNLSVPMQQVYLPVFGIAHGSKTAAFVSVIESAAEFCEIEANPAGNILDYFWEAPRFIYHELYWQPTGATTGFNTASSQINTVNAKLTYFFLHDDEADYVGMANKYKETLVQKGILTKNYDSGSEIPLKLDAIMAEASDSIIGTSLKVMTTTENVSRWISSLKSSGIDNLVMSLIGAEKGGISGHKIGTFNIDGKIGGESGLRKLFSDAVANNVLLTLQTNYALGYTHQLSAGNSIYSINGSFIEEQIPKPLFSTKRFQDNESVLSIANKLKSQKDYKKNLSLDSIAHTLLSNYKNGKNVSREQAKGNIENIMSVFSENANSLLVEAPNDYAFSFAEMIYNTPDVNSMQIYQSDMVPFYQIVLSGYVEMFTPYLNYRSNSERDLLKIIDYNMYPTYLLTEEASNEFARTNIVDVYSSRFEDWKPIILSSYEKVNSVLKNVKGQEIISRNVVSENIVVVGYTGGGKIVVNYSENPYQYEGITVDALSSAYVGGR